MMKFQKDFSLLLVFFFFPHGVLCVVKGTTDVICSCLLLMAYQFWILGSKILSKITFSHAMCLVARLDADCPVESSIKILDWKKKI